MPKLGHIFIIKGHFDQILTKSINQWGGELLLLFSHQDVTKILKMKKFPLLENCWNWHGGQFWAKKNDSGHKNSFFKRRARFLVVNSRFWWLVPLFRGKFCDIISRNLEELPASNSLQECFYRYNDSCKVLFQSVDFNLVFWHPGLWALPLHPPVLVNDWKCRAW